MIAPDLTLRAAHSLAQLLVGLAQWSKATASYQTALEAGYRQYLAAGSNQERLHFAADHAALFAEDAFCLHQLGKLQQAWVRLEEGRARLLGETLGLEEMARLYHGGKGVSRLRAAREQLALAEAHYNVMQKQRYQNNNLSAQQAYQQSIEAVKKAWHALKQLVQELELEPPSLNAEELANLPLPTTSAALTFLLGNNASYALLLYQGTITTIALPASCTKSKLREQVTSSSKKVGEWIEAFDGHNDVLPAVAAAQQAGKERSVAREQSSSAQEQFQHALEELAQSEGNYQAGWLVTYRIAFMLTYEANHAQAQRAAFRAWQTKIQETLDFIEKELWAPIMKALPSDVQQILLMPTGMTSLLPLHAAAPAYLSVAYIPSLTVWQQSCRRAVTRRADSLFLATPAEDLPFTEAEAEWLTQRFPAGGVKRLLRPQATAQAIQTQASGHGIVHFSGHASYNWNDVSQSALACFDNEPLTLATIRREMDLRAARLVTLSACETGISDVFRSGEEFIGLPASLLEAGAPAVVASLWPVQDVSTAFLMDRFYELWLNHDLSIAQALHQAAQWLRHASKADLLRRITESELPEKTQKGVQKLLDKVIAAQQARMSTVTASRIASQIARKPDEHPFAHPFYWAAFAAYGAVL